MFESAFRFGTCRISKEQFLIQPVYFYRSKEEQVLVFSKGEMIYTNLSDSQINDQEISRHIEKIKTFSTTLEQVKTLDDKIELHITKNIALHPDKNHFIMFKIQHIDAFFVYKNHIGNKSITVYGASGDLDVTTLFEQHTLASLYEVFEKLK